MHWVPVEAFPAPNAPAVAGVEDADDDGHEVASEATFMSGTTVFGDSTYTDDEEANGGAGPGAAVAAEGPDVPRERAHRREGRPPRDTAPKPDAAVAGDKWSARNDADHVGNIGWLFGNWGKRPRNYDMRTHLGWLSAFWHPRPCCAFLGRKRTPARRLRACRSENPTST